MNNIKVTVLMFVYNQEKYLRRALFSVLNQETAFDYEVIVHDDASTDDSAVIINEFARAYPEKIISLRQKKNQMQQGISIVDKYLMPIVRGEYIAFCEGDDYWISKKKLQKQADFLDTHPEYAGTCHNCIVVNEKNERQPLVKKFHPYAVNYRYTLNDLILEARMPGQTAAVMYRHRIQTDMSYETRQAYQNIRYVVGDRRRTLLILLNGPIYCMNRTMSAYRYVTTGGSSWNARIRTKNLAGIFFVQEMDFRRFAMNRFGINLNNDYLLFGTGLMALLRRLWDDSAENRRQWEYVKNETGSIKGYLIFMIKIMPGAVRTLIKRTFHKWKMH